MSEQKETSKKANTVALAHLNTLSAVQLADDEKVANRFVEIYNKVHGSKHGQLFYEKEKFNYMRLISENKDLQQCTKLSLYGCFLDVAVNGMSFEQGTKPLGYMLTRNINTAPKGQDPIWEKRAYYVVSPYGELLMRMRSGHIKHADNPVVVYEGDVFEPGIEDGKKTVSYKMILPHDKKKAVGAFIRITRMDGTIDFEWMTQTDITRLQGYSNKQNKGDGGNDKSNALYKSHNGGVDPGFLAAKMIKHAFRTYPKVRIGQFTELETQKENVEEAIDYGVEVPAGEEAAESFSPPVTLSAPAVVVHESSEDEGGY